MLWQEAAGFVCFAQSQKFHSHKHPAHLRHVRGSCLRTFCEHDSFSIFAVLVDSLPQNVERAPELVARVHKDLAPYSKTDDTMRHNFWGCDSNCSRVGGEQIAQMRGDDLF